MLHVSAFAGVSNIKTCIRSWLLLVAGCVIAALAYPMFLTPNQIAPGGLTGVATIIHYCAGKGPGVGMIALALNVPVFLWGYKSLGSSYALRTLIATILFSVFIDLFSLFTPQEGLVSDPLLAVVFGGVLLGLGLGLIFRADASTCGTDLIAQMIHKHFAYISIGILLLILDCLVVLSAIFTMSLSAALYSMIEIFICSKVIDLVMTGFGNASACFIFTTQPNELADRIMKELDRGVTYLSAEGAYSGREQKVILSVVRSREVPVLKAMINEVDPRAFLFITDTHETLGEGFTRLE